jgi:hypothetical protein
LNLDIECIYLGDADPFGVDIYLQDVVGWNINNLYLENDEIKNN